MTPNQRPALRRWPCSCGTRAAPPARLTSLQLSDVRDEVVKAFQGIAVLRAEDPVDVDRQALPTQRMNSMIDTLNEASAAVRALSVRTGLARLRQELIGDADRLETVSTADGQAVCCRLGHSHRYRRIPRHRRSGDQRCRRVAVPELGGITAPIRRRSSRSSTRSSPLADYQRECTADRKWRS